MKLLNCSAEATGISSDFVQRDQAVVAVERGVLQSLRHHCGRDLLEFHGKTEYRLLVPTSIAAVHVDQQDALHKIEDAQVGSAASLLSGNDRFFGVAPVLIRNLGTIHVGAIDGETGDDFA